MNIFNETPGQEVLLNRIIADDLKVVFDYQYMLPELGFAITSVSREQLEARNGWIVWRGGEQPVGDDVLVDIIWPDVGTDIRIAARNICWNDDRIDIAAYRLHKPKPPKGHPHAELMAQYAEDAKATDKPWELWEWSLKRRPDEWSAMRQEMGFEVRHNYRRKPKTKSVGRLQLDVGVNTEVLKMITDKFNELQGQIDNTKQNLCVAISEESLQEAIDNTVSNIVHYAPSDVALLALNEHLVKLLAKQREMLGIVDE